MFYEILTWSYVLILKLNMSACTKSKYFANSCCYDDVDEHLLAKPVFEIWDEKSQCNRVLFKTVTECVSTKMHLTVSYIGCRLEKNPP